MNFSQYLKKLFFFPDKLIRNSTIFRYVFLLFLGWRLALLFLTYLGIGSLPVNDFYNHKILFPPENIDYWSRWANWDGRGYIDIAANGYVSGITVLFPAYPLLIKLFTLTGLTPLAGGFLISQLCTIFTLFYFYKLIILDFDHRTAKKALLALLIFPTSFYLVALYNESLTLLASVAAFYYARTQKWLLTSIFAGIAASTRIAGLAVIIGIFAEYLMASHWEFQWKNLWSTSLRRFFIYSLLIFGILGLGRNLLFILKLEVASGVIASILELFTWIVVALVAILAFQFLKLIFSKIEWNKTLSLNFLFLLVSFLPPSVYLLYQKIAFGSPLTFLAQESRWGKYLSFPWQAPLYNIQYLLVNLFRVGEYPARAHLRFLIFLVAVVCLLFSIKRFRLSYSLFFLAAMTIPLLSGTLMDFPRYILIAFPMFIVLGMIKNEIFQKGLFIISTLSLAFMAILYFNSYFFM